tara:strand:+ start:5327 stop:5671 length:345 start_codon:yes stop_codon:yes gene_type:complete
MAEPKTLQELIRDSLTRSSEEDMKAIYRENTRRIELERSEATASKRQEGGDHYKKMGVEPWDVVDTWPIEQRIGYYRGGALKYIMRMGSKDESLQEIRKGQHYIQKLLEVLGEK